MKGLKTGGRLKGSPNHTTTELREKLKTIIDTELENLSDTLESLTPKERLELLIKIIPFVIPKPTDEPKEPINEGFNMDLKIVSFIRTKDDPTQITSSDPDF